jgi:hypothetical protein
MENNGYEAMKSNKTIFIKCKLEDAKYIIHGLFVDDMMHIYSCDAMKDEFLALYRRRWKQDGNIPGDDCRARGKMYQDSSR